MKTSYGRAGFTVTELLISVVIIAIGVVGFSTAVGLVSAELQIGERDTDVSMLVADQAERLKSVPYDSVQSGMRNEGEYELAWFVEGNNPKKVILEARYLRRSGSQVADTVVIFIRQ
ncbi:MAG: prepilin-type N-terminal cleavage/methylation domain-containing protein [Gemmatimonadales bacterium]|jgi:prepilin-type N-terminal cleavage/methylation domain-containing protein